MSTVEAKRAVGAWEIEFLEDRKTARLIWYVQVPELLDFLQKEDGTEFAISNTELAKQLRNQSLDPETENNLRANIKSMLDHCRRTKAGLLKKIWS